MASSSSSRPAPSSPPPAKRTKPSPDDEADLAALFAPSLLSAEIANTFAEAYRNSEPYKHAIVPQLFDEKFLLQAREEIMRISFREKETDIYKISQTGDLSNIHLLPADELAQLPTLLRLRNALYSSAFRSFVRTVTGCGPLSGVKTDMSCANYGPGCHLLNHDDVIGTRRVSFILYLPTPTPAWDPSHGGALELYPLAVPATDPPTPAAKPTKSVPPSFNQFAFFEVQPGRSFHSVEEVVFWPDKEAPEKGGPGQRISLSGWFHWPVESEEEYEGPQKEREKSSLEQLYATALKPIIPYPTPPPLPLPVTLAPEETEPLLALLNPAYLSASTLETLRSKFIEDSHLVLADFLRADVAAQLEKLIIAQDTADGLLRPERTLPAPSHGGKAYTVPPHTAGEDASWSLTGPPHIQRYLTLTAPPSLARTQLTALLDSLLALFSTPAFRALLAALTSLAPLAHATEARRFRPGLDYTLARGEPSSGSARLDMGLSLTPGNDADWEAGEVGGWDAWLAADDDSDEATYGAGGGGVDGDEDDGPLLTLPPLWNRLHLILRDPGVLRFVKYLSARAPGPRWDVVGEWEVGHVEEDEGDEDAEGEVVDESAGEGKKEGEKETA